MPTAQEHSQTMQPNPPAAPPRDPLDAVTHPDPYPFYAALAAERPFERDGSLGMWVAAGAAAVTAVLGSDLCRVRPPAEPVPRALVGSPAGEVFRQLVRMNDGAGHCPFRHAVTAALASIDGPRAAARSAESARRLLAESAPGEVAGGLASFAARLPVEVVGSLLGIPAAELAPAAAWVGAFAACLAPAAAPEAIERGNVAAAHLLDLCRGVAEAPQAEPAGDDLLATLAREARRVGRDDPQTVAANAVGFMFQSYDATAGLLGNTLRALAQRPALLAALAGEPELLGEIVQEVLRHDPPVQNTRRFVAGAGEIAGRALAEGDAILVVLAAANRDPAANPRPEVFDARRRDRRVFTFGSGIHACPGEALAAAIAAAGVAALLDHGLEVAALGGPCRYRPSANVRIPLLEIPPRRR